MLTRAFGILAVLSVLACSALAADKQPIVGRASVIDGDTIEIHGKRIRLHGIDAPEGRQPCKDASGKSYRCGQRAAFVLSDKIGTSAIRCDPKSTDRYRRTVAVCWLGKTNLNAWIVSEGWAIAYRYYSMKYVPQEEQARSARRGLWAGSFDEPYQWRKSKRK